MTKETQESAETDLNKDDSQLQRPLQEENENADSLTSTSYEIQTTCNLSQIRVEDTNPGSLVTPNLRSAMCDTMVTGLENGSALETLNPDSIELSGAAGLHPDFSFLTNKAGSGLRPLNPEDNLGNGSYTNPSSPSGVELTPLFSGALQTGPLVPTTDNSDVLPLSFANEDIGHPVCIHCPADPTTESYTEWIGSCTCTCNRCLPIPSWSFGGWNDPFESVNSGACSTSFDDHIDKFLESRDDFSSGDRWSSGGGLSSRDVIDFGIDSLASAFGNLAFDAPPSGHPTRATLPNILRRSARRYGAGDSSAFVAGIPQNGYSSVRLHRRVNTAPAARSLLRTGIPQNDYSSVRLHRRVNTAPAARSLLRTG